MDPSEVGLPNRIVVSEGWLRNWLACGLGEHKDWSSFPTLAQVKREYRAKIQLGESNAKLEAQDKAREESIAKMQNAAFDRKMRQTNAEIEAQNAIAKLTRELTLEESRLSRQRLMRRLL